MEIPRKKITKYTLAVFIEKAVAKHGNKCDYSMVSEDDIKTCRSRINIKCTTCNMVTSQTVVGHINSKNGCLICAKSYKWSLDIFLERANKIHGDKYDYSMITNLKEARSKIPVRCKKCNLLWNPTISHHINDKQGCPECCVTNKWTADKFLERAKEIHNDIYLYDTLTVENISGAASRVNITCKFCNKTWTTTVNAHINNITGCGKCKRVKRWTLQLLFEKAQQIHGDKYDYSQTKQSDVTGRESKITVLCNDCQYVWYPSIHNHINGKSGCPNCAGCVKWTLERFLLRSQEIHGNQYDYSQIKGGDIVNNKCKIAVVCNICKYNWLTSVSEHINLKTNCPSCTSHVPWSLERFTTRASAIHGNNYSYLKVKENDIVNGDSKITVICNSCQHVWYPSIHNHINNKSGCPQCSGHVKWTLDRFIKRAQELHGNKYDYSNIQESNVSSNNRIILACNVCEYIWHSSIHNHINSKRGCPNCAGRAKWTFDRFIKKSIEIHGEKYDYSQIKEKDVINVKSYVPIKCNKCHHIWFQSINSHINQIHGCPHCVNTRGYSDAEIVWIETIMKTEGISIQYAKSLEGQYKIKFPGGKLRSVDGYCQETNTVYEYNGNFWHGNPRVYKPNDMNTVAKKTFGELYMATISKESTIKQLGYNLIVKWETPCNILVPQRTGYICKMFMKTLADLSAYALKYNIDSVMLAFKTNVIADRGIALLNKNVKEDFIQIENAIPENACQALNVYKQNNYQIVTQCDEESYNLLVYMNDSFRFCDVMSIYTKRIIKKYCILVSFIVHGTN